MIGSRISSIASSGHNCFAVWTNERPGEEAANATAAAANGTVVAANATVDPSRLHRSGYRVKMMGCFPKSEDCQSREQCLEERNKETHLFCCCRGDLCNAEFMWVPRKAPAAPDKPPKGANGGGGDVGGKYALLVGMPVFLGVAALVSGLACAYVHRQRKALHGEGERMPEGGAGGGAGGGHDLEQQSPGLKGKTVEVRFA